MLWWLSGHEKRNKPEAVELNFGWSGKNIFMTSKGKILQSRNESADGRYGGRKKCSNCSLNVCNEIVLMNLSAGWGMMSIYLGWRWGWCDDWVMVWDIECLWGLQYAWLVWWLLKFVRLRQSLFSNNLDWPEICNLQSSLRQIAWWICTASQYQMSSSISNHNDNMWHHHQHQPKTPQTIIRLNERANSSCWLMFIANPRVIKLWKLEHIFRSIKSRRIPHHNQDVRNKLL